MRKPDPKIDWYAIGLAIMLGICIGLLGVPTL